MHRESPIGDLTQEQRERGKNALLRALRTRYPGRPVSVKWDEPNAVPKPAPRRDDPPPPYVFPGPSYRWGGFEGEYAEVLLRDPCSYCGGQEEHRAVDHIQPRRRDGAHSWENLTAVCRSCNASKGAETLLRFLARRVA